jgi:hypothetical protein
MLQPQLVFAHRAVGNGGSFILVPGTSYAAALNKGISTDMTEHISFESPLPSVLSVDGTERVMEFLRRHGGADRDAEHEENTFAGESGCSEAHASDGYRLRCEWSTRGSERQMSFVEIAPGASIIVDNAD